jgi:hypothetical protein
MRMPYSLRVGLFCGLVMYPFVQSGASEGEAVKVQKGDAQIHAVELIDAVLGDEADEDEMFFDELESEEVLQASDIELNSMKLRLQAIENHYDDLEFEKALSLCHELLSIAGVPKYLKIEAYRFKAFTLIALGQSVNAEEPFRLMLRIDAETELSASTPPKIMAVFRKVQAEELATLRQAAALKQQKIIESVLVQRNIPNEGEGAKPFALTLKIDDPSEAVRYSRFHYRRKNDPAYALVPFLPSKNGQWSALLPAQSTVSDDGMELEYYLTLLDEKRDLLRQEGTEDSPFSIQFTAGRVQAEAPPIYQQAWFWPTLGAAGGVTVAVVAGIILAPYLSSTDW